MRKVRIGLAIILLQATLAVRSQFLLPSGLSVSTDKAPQPDRSKSWSQPHTELGRLNADRIYVHLGTQPLATVLEVVRSSTGARVTESLDPILFSVDSLHCLDGLNIPQIGSVSPSDAEKLFDLVINAAHAYQPPPKNFKTICGPPPISITWTVRGQAGSLRMDSKRLIDKKAKTVRIYYVNPEDRLVRMLFTLSNTNDYDTVVKMMCKRLIRYSRQ